MTVRTRFAPSPTGQVHIGNMRPAIYCWLFARRHGGQFLLRIEDTDRERSTPDAIRAVLDAMTWMNLDFDEEPLYQSHREAAHREAAERLVAEGKAYRHRKGDEGEATLFRIPWNTAGIPFVRTIGPTELALHPDVPVQVASTGVAFALVSKNGKPMPHEASLAGFRDLELLDAAGATVFALNDCLNEVLAGARRVEVPGAHRIRFTRREAVFHDLVKGELAKPLDGMKDLVIVRTGGIPLFHLANVCDDIHQRVSHIIRGDDHVENTFRHILLFHALGAPLPTYAHLPMIVNAQGKPYSKRDGDAFVGDFRAHGYLGEALFNYLALLQWSPGDDRQIVSRDEMVRLFDLARVNSSPAQVDLRKLQWMNGAYMAAQPPERRLADAQAELRKHGLWTDAASNVFLQRVLDTMGDRLKLTTDIATQAGFFFTEEYAYDEQAVGKRLTQPGAADLLTAIAARFATLPAFEAPAMESALAALAQERGAKPADLIHATRAAVSGLAIGPGLFEMLVLLGRERVLARLARTVKRFAPAA
jgi:glutamyl-tRNA synthetase